jgi:hypothetical protein
MSLEVLERVQMVSLMILGLSDGTIYLYLLVGWIQFGYCGLNGVLVGFFGDILTQRRKRGKTKRTLCSGDCAQGDHDGFMLKKKDLKAEVCQKILHFGDSRL